MPTNVDLIQTNVDLIHKAPAALAFAALPVYAKNQICLHRSASCKQLFASIRHHKFALLDPSQSLQQALLHSTLLLILLLLLLEFGLLSIFPAVAMVIAAA